MIINTLFAKREIPEVMEMLKKMNHEKEKRDKRLKQKNRRKRAVHRKFEEIRKCIKQVLYEDRYLGNWELINSR